MSTDSTHISARILPVAAVFSHTQNLVLAATGDFLIRCNVWALLRAVELQRTRKQLQLDK